METYGKTFAAVYDQLFGGHAENAAQILLGFMGTRVRPGDLPRVLDLGCGTGQGVRRFLEAGYPVTGLDLSGAMLEVARTRCRSFTLSGRVQWVESDMAGFELTGPFGLAFSTYNSLNHLDSEERLKVCFCSVRKCLAPKGWFIFDYHTLRGIGEWTDHEEGSFPLGNLRVERSFDATAGKAWMRVTGTWGGVTFEEKVLNSSFEMSKIVQWLNEEGFSKVVLSDWQSLPEPLEDPEKGTRVVILAQI